MRNLFKSLMLMVFCANAAQARELDFEVSVLHVGGMLPAAELDAMLKDERLGIEAVYHPTRLIEGVTARRERTMPLGSRLHAIPRSASLRGAQIARDGRTLRFKVPEVHPDHGDYRLLQLTLRVPMARGLGRPVPDLEIGLVNPVPRSGIHETAVLNRYGAFDLGLRLRHRWSGESGATQYSAPTCPADVVALGNGEYRFRPRHRVSGLMRFLASDVHSDPPARPPAGQRSLRMAEPFPEPLTGMKLSRNHLIQLQVDGEAVERLSLYGVLTGSGRCRRTRSYEALFSGERLVAMQRSVYETDCEGDAGSHTVEAEWLEDGSLARHVVSSPASSHAWDAFTASVGTNCTPDAAPPADSVRALQSELQRIRAAFLR